MTLSLTRKTKGIKEHEELEVLVEEQHSQAVWVRAVEVDEKGDSVKAVAVPLSPQAAREHASNVIEAADHAK